MPQGADDAVIAETFRHDGLVVDVTAENFQGLVQQSVQHPVIRLFTDEGVVEV